MIQFLALAVLVAPTATQVDLPVEIGAFPMPETIYYERSNSSANRAIDRNQLTWHSGSDIWKLSDPSKKAEYWIVAFSDDKGHPGAGLQYTSFTESTTLNLDFTMTSNSLLYTVNLGNFRVLAVFQVRIGPRNWSNKWKESIFLLATIIDPIPRSWREFPRWFEKCGPYDTFFFVPQNGGLSVTTVRLDGTAKRTQLTWNLKKIVASKGQETKVPKAIGDILHRGRLECLDPINWNAVVYRSIERSTVFELLDGHTGKSIPILRGRGDQTRYQFVQGQLLESANDGKRAETRRIDSKTGQTLWHLPGFLAGISADDKVIALGNSETKTLTLYRL